MWGYEAYVKNAENGKETDIRERTGSYRIADLIFPGENKNTGMLNAVEKSMKSLQNQYAYDKIKIIVDRWNEGSPKTMDVKVYFVEKDDDLQVSN